MNKTITTVALLALFFWLLVKKLVPWLKSVQASQGAKLDAATASASTSGASVPFSPLASIAAGEPSAAFVAPDFTPSPLAIATSTFPTPLELATAASDGGAFAGEGVWS